MINLNGGDMKTFTKQTNKWLLSTLLVAALGSQYYFSVSSNSIGNFEMSSEVPTAADELATRLKTLDATPELTAADLPQLEKRRKEIIAEFEPKIAAEKKAATEAKTVGMHCADCGVGGITVTGSEKAIAAVAARLSTKKSDPIVAATPALAVTITPATVTAKEEVKFETARERREREKEERDEAKAEVKRKKDDIKEAKADKLKDEKETRNEEFAEKAEEIAEKCLDNLSCKVNRLTTLMNRYTGKKKIDMFVVNKAYNQYIDKDLKAGLRGEDGSEGKAAALEAIAALTGALTGEYKSLKTRTVDSAKAAQTSAALAVNGLYKQADLYLKQNKPIEAKLSHDKGVKDEATFRQDAEVIYQSMYHGLDSSKDQTTLDYVRNHYVPDVAKLLTQLSNTTATIGQTVNSSTTTVGSGRIARGGNVGSATTVNGSTIINSGNTIGNGNVQFGTTSPSRAVNRTGLNLK